MQRSRNKSKNGKKEDKNTKLQWTDETIRRNGKVAWLNEHFQLEKKSTHKKQWIRSTFHKINFFNEVVSVRIW